MVHQTFRRLDEPTKLAGLSLAQWAALIVAGAVLGLVLARLDASMKATLTIAAFALGAPAAIMHTAEDGRIAPGRLLRDALRALLQADQLAAGASARPAGYLIASDDHAAQTGSDR